MSTISHHESEAPAIYDARQRRFAHLWLAGQIGDMTYLRSRLIDGGDISDINAELALLRMEKQERRRG